MTKTVTSLFHSEQEAATAASRLEQAGIRSDEIDIWSTPHNLASLLEDEGVSRTDAYAYAEGVIRGGSVVIVKCDDDEVAQVISILDQQGVLDLDEQQASWRSEGWQEAAGSSNPAQSGPGTGYDLTGSPDMSEARTDMAAIGRSPEAGHGRVRVQTRRGERPAQE